MIDILGKTGVAALMFTLLYVSMLFLPNGQKIVDTINAKFFHRYTLITRTIMIFSCISNITKMLRKNMAQYKIKTNIKVIILMR